MTQQLANVPRNNLAAPVGNPSTMKTLIASMSKQIADILPKHITAERMAKAALVAINRQPKLLDCTQASVMQAIMEASGLGLDPSGGVLGHGYLVPYKTTCTFVPGYRGLCDLARRGGDVRFLEAQVVYRGDEFDYGLGTKRFITHKRLDEDERDEDITHAYAIAWLTETEFQFEVMTRRQIDKTMFGSQSKGNWGPWKDHYPEMARKTPIRRLTKLLSISSERLARAIEVSDRAEAGHTVESIVDMADSLPPRQQNAGDALADQLGTSGTADTLADQQSDQPPEQQQSDSPAPDVAASYSNFVEAVRKYAAANNIGPDECEEAIKKMPLVTGQFVKSTQASVGPAARARVWDAIQVGAFDWATGKAAE
jgi:recombination protein RecT